MPSLKTRRRTDRPARSRQDEQIANPGQKADPRMVADLSAEQITHMSRGELAEVVRAGRLPNQSVRTEYFDRGTLERMAYLSRLSCRNRELSAAKPR